MRRSFLKLLGAALALCLVLSGCNMIKVDQLMQIAEDTKALDKTQAKKVVEYDGGEITLGEVAYDYTYNYNYMYQLYSMYGMSMDASVATNLHQTVAEQAMNTRATLLKAEELGIALTEEEEAECLNSAESTYQESYDEYYSEHADGETDEIKAAQTEYALKASGITKDVLTFGNRSQKIIEKVKEQVRGEISEVTDDELKSVYDKKVAEDEASYETTPENLASDMMEEDKNPYWFPSGYRTVKHILLKMEGDAMSDYAGQKTAADTLQGQLDDLNEELATLTAAENEEAAEDETTAEETTERTQADVEAEIAELTGQLESAKVAMEEARATVLAEVQDKLDDIYARVEAGEDFDELIAEYGEDPGMQNEPTASRGYYVAADNTNWDPAFLEAAMALENEGDVSEPVIGTAGVHIIRYETTVPVGAVPFEEIKDSMYDDALETMRDEHYDAELKAWVDALHPVYHADNWG